MGTKEEVFSYMWTSRACTCLSSRSGELVAGGNYGRQHWEDRFSSVERGGAERMELVVVRAKVAVGENGWSARLLTEAGGGASKLACLKFAGTLDKVDSRSSGKVTGLGTQKGRVVIIAGPTAVGKSRVAIDLAKQLGGEIISADSIQVYQGLNVGSAKTPLHEREGIPHHLVDIVPPTEEYSASQFCKDARDATKLVLDRGRVPIVVGGTCSYLRWYMNGKTGASYPSSQQVNAAIEGKIRRLVSHSRGWEFAVHMLAQAGDPDTAYNLARNDWHRFGQALQAILVSGQSRGVFPSPHNYKLDHTDGSEWDCNYDFQCYFLYQQRAELYRWIDLRCEHMLVDPRGLLQEAAWLLDIGVMPDTSSASRGIGYQEAMEFLVDCRRTGGNTTEERFLAFLSGFQHISRSLVKKQLKWFRSDQHSDVKQFHWIDASQPTDQILEALRKEYWRRPGYPSELKGSDAMKEASYKEGKTLKHYKAKNRIFTDSTVISPVLRWVKQTQGGRSLSSRNLVRF